MASDFIRIYDKDLNLLREFSDFDHLLFTERAETIGEFEFETHETDVAYDECYIRCGRRPELSGKIEYRHSEDGVYTYKGYSLLAMLYDRFCVPTSSMADGYYHYKDAYAEDIIYDLVNKNAVNPEDAERKINHLRCRTSRQRGGKMTLDVRFDRLTDAITSICEESGLSVRVDLLADEKVFEFVVYKGVDRTKLDDNRYLIEERFDRVDSTTFEWSSLATANYAIVLGQGDGAERTRVDVDRTDGAPRREIVVDARDIPDEELDDNGNTVEDYDVEESLRARGIEKLNELKQALSREFVAAGDDYNSRYGLGDWLLYRDAEMTQSGKVTEALHAWEDGEYTVSVTVGHTVATILSAIQTAGNDAIVERAGIDVGLNQAYFRCGALEADSAIIHGSLEAHDAHFTTLETDSAVIHGSLEAHDAHFTELETDNATIKGKLTAHEADITTLTADTATVKAELNAATANITLLSADSAYLKEAVAEKLSVDDFNASNATITNLIATKANITDLTAATGRITDLESDNVTVKNTLNAAVANIGDLTADSATIKGKLEAAEADITDLTTAHANVTGRLEAAEGSITSLTADTASISGKLEAAEGNILTLTTENATVKGRLNAAEGNITTLTTENTTVKGRLDAAEAVIDDLDATYAKITTLNAATGRIDTLETGYATVNTALIGKADIDLANVQAGSITTAMIGEGVVGTAQIADGSITDAKIVGLTASKITAGTLDAGTIDVVNLNADNITVGTINGQLIGAGSVDMEKLSEGVVETIDTLGVDIEQAKADILGVDSKIDNLEIGGRNLLKNSSANLGNFNGWVKALTSSTNGTVDVGYTTNGYGGQNALEVNVSDASTATYTGRLFPLWTNTNISSALKALEQGDEIILSGWYYLDSDVAYTANDCSIFIRELYSNGITFVDTCIFKVPSTTKDSWVRFSIKGSLEWSSSDRHTVPFTFHCVFNNKTTGHIKFSQLKIEKGSKATDWAPAPEDIYSAISTAQATADSAMSTADGKNTVYRQSTTPSTTGRKTGDVWFDTANDNRIYIWSGSAWTLSELGEDAIADLAITNAKIADATIQSAKIANLDAGKITTGTLDANRIAAGSLSVGKLSDLSVSGRNLVVDGELSKIGTNANLTKGSGIFPASWDYYNTGVSNYQNNFATYIDQETFGYNVAVFNESDGTRHWKALSKSIVAGWGFDGSWDHYRLSIDVYATGAGTKLTGGFYYARPEDNGTRNFRSGYFSVPSSKISVGEWSRVSVEIPYNHDWDGTSTVTFFLYGYNFSADEILYVKNISINNATVTCDFTRNTGEISVENIYTAGTTTIDGAKITTGSIVASKIAANAITADKIAANAITSAKIQAGAITAAALSASAVTADKIAAGAVNADKIAAGSITADKIVADAITTDKVAAHAITANELATGCITAASGIIASIDASKITTGTLDAERIAAGSLSVGQLGDLKIGGRNLIVGSSKQATVTNNTVHGWYKNSTDTTVSQTTIDGVDCFYLSRPSATTHTPTATLSLLGCPRVEPNTTYTYSGWLRFSQDMPNYAMSFAPLHYQIQKLTGDDALSFERSGSHANQTYTAKLVEGGGGFVAGEWKRIVIQITIGDLDSSYPYIYFRPFIYGPISAAGTETPCTEVWFKGVKLEKGTVATDWTPAPEDVNTAIAEGSISNWCYENNMSYIDGGHIYTGTITAEKIKAGTITADKLATGTITSASGVIGSLDAGDIKTGTLSADRIGAKTITVDKLDSKAISVGSRNLILNSATKQITAYNGGGTYTAATMTTTTGVAVSEWGAKDAFTCSGTASSEPSGLLGTLATGRSSSSNPTGLQLDQEYVGSIYIKNNHSTNDVKVRFNGYRSASSETVTVNAGECKRITVRHTGNTTSAYNIQMNFHSGGGASSGYNFTYWHPQIEVGYFASDWSPAPEDISVENIYSTGTTTIDGGKITTGTITATAIAANTITAAKIATGAITADKIASSAITADKVAAGAITATKISVDNLSAVSANLGTITTGKLQDTSGNITMTLDGTNSELTIQGAKLKIVGSTGTKTGASLADQQIGGNNLLYGTKKFDPDYWAIPSSWTRGSVGTNTSLRISGVSGGSYDLITKIGSKNDQTVYAGRQYTLSFWAKGTGTIQSAFYGTGNYLFIKKMENSQDQVTTSSTGNMYGTSTFTLSSSWTKYWVTWTVGSQTNHTSNSTTTTAAFNAFSPARVQICRPTSTDTTVEIYAPMLEEGNVASAWCEHLSDYGGDGINLLDNSSFNRGDLSCWTRPSTSTADGTFSYTRYSANSEYSNGKTPFLLIKRTATGTDTSRKMIYNTTATDKIQPMKAGDTFTMSGYYYLLADSSTTMSDDVQIFCRQWDPSDSSKYKDTGASVTLTPSATRSSWIYFEATGTVPYTAGGSFRFCVAMSGTGGIRLSGIKIEKGTKATEWTQSAEDDKYYTLVDWCVDNDTTVIDGAKIGTGTIEAKSIKANTITADKLATNVLTVGNISDLETGGRNMVLKSDTRQLSAYSGASLTHTTGQSVSAWGATTAIRVTGTKGSDNIFGTLATGRSSTSDPPNVSVSGQAYSYSVYIKNNGDPLRITNSLGDDVTIASGVTKRITLKGTGNGSNYLQFAFSTSGSNIDFVYWHPQIELGTVVSDWTPAPEDTTSSIATAKQTADKGVKYANDAQESIETAQNDLNALGDRVGEAEGLLDTARANVSSALETLARVTYNGKMTYIDGGNIYTGTVTAKQINVTELSALSANLGNITTGTISNPAQTITMDFTGGADDGIKVTSPGADTILHMDTDGTRVTNTAGTTVARFTSSGTETADLTADGTCMLSGLKVEKQSDGIWISYGG